ncbi:ComEA family DNA-binding protein [Microbacterium sp. NC79]|uniref:ComEA family DNA-binding protein n=1 Tax=Microbacterium sp. NC79 TaxID=2851009 RepID=UPI001C2CA002|nr:ComEA family DNA-binding protein [Microbacterium sp. NC79]MBV0895076.1 ComEA family DNA-binding protein [Microbacterium sp. NC79]
MSESAQPRGRALRIGIGAALILIVGVFAVVVGMGVVRSAGEQVVSVPVSGATAEPLYVDVQGAVAAPGVYLLDADARVVDAVAAAGGFRDDADSSGINLARLVIDGEQLVVPTVSAEGSAAAPIDDGLININAADTAELEELPRIGEALASRIIAWREENGPFRTVDDLGNVSGIGKKMLETLRPLVKVG